MESKVSGNTLHNATTFGGEVEKNIIGPLDVVVVHKIIHQGEHEGAQKPNSDTATAFCGTKYYY